MTAGEFWAWFVENEGRYREVRFNDEDPLLAELLGTLRAYNERLGFGISPASDGPPRQLLVSADGCEMLFPAVDELVRAAPAIEGWEFLGFKPGRGFGFTIKFEDVTFDPAVMRFETIEDIDGQGRLGLRVYVPGLPEGRVETAIRAVWEILEMGLGERVCWSEVGSVEIVTDEGLEGWGEGLPLTNLGTLLDWRRRKVAIAGEGTV